MLVLIRYRIQSTVGIITAISLIDVLRVDLVSVADVTFAIILVIFIIVVVPAGHDIVSVIVAAVALAVAHV
ncbi:Hypothetical predicted protein [Octopus vulgaris]|uniref:Uncharacterized protein n=1 Tax=Octopus vulgaris TaxID=6645 RepID=A0AA36AGB9_OCTVU|nr:Hypothetical predicted protein [Octopus vulgaris]